MMLKMIFAMILTAHGLTLDGKYARAVIRTRKNSELRGLNERYDHLITSRLACREQIHRGEAPIKCFEALKKDVFWGLISPHEHKIAEQRLEKLCEKAADHLALPEKMQISSEVPQKCRLRLLHAQKLRDYRRESDSGAKIDSLDAYVE